jgi:hypothetical protein
MTAMMIDDGKRVAAGGARLQWHMIPIADIDLIARNTRGEENASRLGLTSIADREAIGAPRTSYLCASPESYLIKTMQPGEALSSAAEIAVALAGFAGVVVAFRSSSLHEWPPLDKHRLWLLLSSAR